MRIMSADLCPPSDLTHPTLRRRYVAHHGGGFSKTELNSVLTCTAINAKFAIIVVRIKRCIFKARIESAIMYLLAAVVVFLVGIILIITQ